MEGVGAAVVLFIHKGERPLLEQALEGAPEGFLVGGRDPEVKATQPQPPGL